MHISRHVKFDEASITDNNFMYKEIRIKLPHLKNVFMALSSTNGWFCRYVESLMYSNIHKNL